MFLPRELDDSGGGGWAPQPAYNPNQAQVQDEKDLGSAFWLMIAGLVCFALTVIIGLCWGYAFAAGKSAAEVYFLPLVFCIVMTVTFGTIGVHRFFRWCLF